MTLRPIIKLDIETVPLASSMAEPYPASDRNPPANYKSDDAIAKWREKDEREWREGRAKECSLTPRLGRVLCIGVKHGALATVVHMAPTEADERRILTQFWDSIGDSELPTPLMVTWNGMWDLRFILLRSIMLGVTPSLPSKTMAGWFRKYTYDQHFDCKAALTNWEPRSTEGLDEWARSLGVRGKTPGLRGADVYPLYLAGMLDEISTYCGDDVESLSDVYDRIHPYYG